MVETVKYKRKSQGSTKTLNRKKNDATPIAQSFVLEYVMLVCLYLQETVNNLLRGNPFQEDWLIISATTQLTEMERGWAERQREARRER